MRKSCSCTSFALLVLLLMPGCSSTINVGRLEPKPSSPPSTPPVIDGIPFRVPSIYTVRVYQRKGATYEEKAHFVHQLADPQQLYTLNFNSQALADQKFNLKIRPDGTLEVLDLKETKKVDEALTEFGAQAVALYSAIGKRDLDEANAQKTALDAQKALLDSQALLDGAVKKPDLDQDIARVAALEALNAANAAERTLLAQANASPAEKAPLEDALRLARLKANQAFKRAGLEPPFPDAFP